MILKRLRLHGFKSFYRKSDLDFGPGITAIVGPNGCGKSNISDSIRWVLGEQNPRVLRGRRMDDTIFKGTETRRALNMTEASLTFDNRAGIVSLPYDEITLTRKIFRSGESVYRINGTECRLKDMNDMIRDLGVGRDAYSLIEQRMIDQILNDRGGERRYILEEAAGIVRYKERRRLAERKLARTRIDLEQIQILVDEVERTVRGLKRHVGKARRYRAFRDREREIETALARRDHEEWSGRIAEISVRLASLEDEREGATSRVERIDGTLGEKRAGIQEREAALDEVRRGYKRGMLRAKELDERLAVLGERRRSRVARLEAIRAEAAEAERAREGLRSERAELERETEEAEARRVEIRGRLESLEAERERALGGLEERLAAARAQADRRVERLSRAAEIRMRLEAVDEERSALQRRREELQATLDECEHALEALGGDREGFAREIAGLRSIVDQSSARLEELGRRREAVTERRECSDREMRKRQLVLNNVMAQLEIRQKWRQEFEGFPPGVSAVMRARGDLPGVIGPLAELLEIDEKFVRAIEAGLGLYLRMLVTEDSAAAVRAIEYLRREGKGTASFLPVEMAGNGHGPRVPKPPAWVIATGADVVACEVTIQPLKDLLLGDLWIVPPPHGEDDVDAYLHAPARVVSLDGALLRDRMIIRGGQRSDPEALLLHRARRIDELKEEAERLKRAFQEARSDLSRLTRILREADEEQQGLSRRSLEETGTLREREVSLVHLEREETRLRGEIDGFREKLAAVDTRLAGKVREARDLRAAGDEAERLAESMEGDAAEGALAEIREVGARFDREIEALKMEGASLDSRLLEAAKRAQWVGRQVEEKTSRIRRLEGERAEAEGAGCASEAEERKIRSERDLVAAEIERVEGGLGETEGVIRREREEIEREEGTLRTLRARIDAHTAEIQRLELERNDLTNRIEALSERIEEKYGVALADLPAPDAVDPRPADEIRGELRRLREKIGALGRVNFVALEEYEEAEERYDRLRTQRDDLVAGKESLETTIRRINRTARERFLVTFGEVRSNFREIFRLLFRGGRADLILENEEDPLECGIEMVAQPCGKKFDSVDLLSGGERALTSLALLFSIYRVKPSPFCILDEADAALDDVNVERLIEMLKGFREHTQFLVITHNKKTMSAADYLYGVTMEEPGVSKVVSVTLEAAGDGDRTARARETARA